MQGQSSISTTCMYFYFLSSDLYMKFAFFELFSSDLHMKFAFLFFDVIIDSNSSNALLRRYSRRPSTDTDTFLNLFCIFFVLVVVSVALYAFSVKFFKRQSYQQLLTVEEGVLHEVGVCRLASKSREVPLFQPQMLRDP